MNDPTQAPHENRATSAPAPLRKRRGPLITGFSAVLDACILANSTIRDFVLYAAYLALYRPIWSEDILLEFRRTLAKFGLQPERIDYIIEQMTSAFPEACVEDYATLVPSMTNDPGDRHVLAAAVAGKAQLIVTENTRHFPDSALAPYHVEAATADDFLRDLLDLDPERMIEVLTTIAESRKMPPRTVDELLQAAERNGCLGFAADMRAALDWYYADN